MSATTYLRCHYCGDVLKMNDVWGVVLVCDDCQAMGPLSATMEDAITSHKSVVAAIRWTRDLITKSGLYLFQEDDRPFITKILNLRTEVDVAAFHRDQLVGQRYGPIPNPYAGDLS